MPPATSTRPSSSNALTWPPRPTLSEPVALQVSVARSKSSEPVNVSCWPGKKTRPSESNCIDPIAWRFSSIAAVFVH